MKRIHSEKVLGLDGTPFKQGDDKPMTMKDLVITTLGGENPEEKLGAEKKARCWALLGKFMKGKKVNITSEEGALIKERAAVMLNVFYGSNILYGRLCDWIEGKEPVVESDDDSDEESDGVGTGDEGEGEDGADGVTPDDD